MLKRWEDCTVLTEDILGLLKSDDPVQRAKGVADIEDLNYLNRYGNRLDTPDMLQPLVHMLGDSDPFVVILALDRLKVVLGHQINKDALLELDREELEQAVEGICRHLGNNASVIVPEQFRSAGFARCHIEAENIGPVGEYAAKALKWLYGVNRGVYDVLSKLASLAASEGVASKRAVQLFADLMGRALPKDAARFIDNPCHPVGKAARERLSAVICGIAARVEAIDPENVEARDEHHVQQKLFHAVAELSKVEQILAGKPGGKGRDGLLDLLRSRREPVKQRLDATGKSICQRIDESRRAGKLRPPSPRLKPTSRRIVRT